MGWQSELNGRCKKHPKHKQSPGVCSTCLRERLTQVIASSCSSSSAKRTNRITTASSSFSSSLSSTSSEEVSSCASPMSTSSVKVPKSAYNNFKSASEDDPGLTRSRSMASAAKSWVIDHSMGMRSTTTSRENKSKINKKKENIRSNDTKTSKKSGFWSKLLVGSYSNRTKSNRKNKEVVLMHSKTVK